MKLARDYDTRETSARCLADAYLRSFGFKILSRPADGEPWWLKDGIAYTQTQAMRATSPKEAKK